MIPLWAGYQVSVTGLIALAAIALIAVFGNRISKHREKQ